MPLNCKREQKKKMPKALGLCQALETPGIASLLHPRQIPGHSLLFPLSFLICLATVSSAGTQSCWCCLEQYFPTLLKVHINHTSFTMCSLLSHSTPSGCFWQLPLLLRLWSASPNCVLTVKARLQVLLHAIPMVCSGRVWLGSCP